VLSGRGRVSVDDRPCRCGGQRDGEIWVLTATKCCGAHFCKFVERREAEIRRGAERPVAEAAQNVLVVGAIQTVGMGDDRIHRGAQMPATVFLRDRGPCARLCSVTELFPP
jgi:hypothetical protein